MRMKRHPRAVVPQMRVFQCPACGTKLTVTKMKGRTGIGHQKDLYCYVCRERTKQTQIE